MKQALPVASSMAFFQSLFPVLGWYVGTTLFHLIKGVDHWIAFGLLVLIGVKMMVEGFRFNGALNSFDPFNKRLILGLSIATSIDALVVGLSFGFIKVPILYPVVIIGSVTFLFSMLGMFFGKHIPFKTSQQTLIIFGGLILTALGLKILIEHL